MSKALNIKGKAVRKCRFSLYDRLAIKSIEKFSSLLHFLIVRQMIHTLQGVALYFETKTILSIEKQKEMGPQSRIVAHCLFKGLLRDFHSLRLAFHNHQRLHVIAKDNGIATLVQTVHLNRILHCKQTSRTSSSTLSTKCTWTPSTSIPSLTGVLLKCSRSWILIQPTFPRRTYKR